MWFGLLTGSPRSAVTVVSKSVYFFYIFFYCTTSLIIDYKYTYVTINGL